MQGWQTPYLGLRDIPRDLSGFELQAFFTFSRAERELIEARRGDPIYEAGVQLGRLLRTAFLADYFVNVAFRRELRRVLNRRREKEKCHSS